MAHFKFAVVFLALVFSGSSFSFYADASSPASWRTVAGATSYSASAADISFANGIRSKIAGASVNVGGKAIAMEVAYKFSPTAARVAASAAYLNPLAFTALTVGMVGYEAYKWYSMEHPHSSASEE